MLSLLASSFLYLSKRGSVIFFCQVNDFRNPRIPDSATFMSQKDSLRHHQTTPLTIREESSELGHRKSRIDDAVESQEAIKH